MRPVDSLDSYLLGLIFILTLVQYPCSFQNCINIGEMLFAENLLPVQRAIDAFQNANVKSLPALLPLHPKAISEASADLLLRSLRWKVDASDAFITAILDQPCRNEASFHAPGTKRCDSIFNLLENVAHGRHN